MESSVYYNHPRTHEIVEEIKKCPTLQDVLNLVHKTFPKWIVEHCPDYSPDYKMFSINWGRVCTEIGVAKSDVILVSFLPPFGEEKSNQYTLITMFAELLTLFGISVKLNTHFVPCTQCRKAIPKKHIYNKYKEHQSSWIPNWSPQCTQC